MAPKKKIVHTNQGGQNDNKDESQFADIKRASWSKELLHFLCDLCIKHVEKSKGKSGGVTSQRLVWKKIELEFQQKTNLQWDKSKLKHKVDWMRSRWGLWKQLRGKETGLGWDHEKGTISATDEWWALKVKENPKFEAFREEGFDSELECKMDQIFGFCAQGALKYTPTPKQGHLQQEDDEIYVPSSNVHLEEMDENDGGSCYYSGSNWNYCWREDSIPTTMHQDSQIERDEQDEQRRGKRVLENETSQSSKSARVEGNKKAGGAVALSEKLDRMFLLVGDRCAERKEVNVLAMDVLKSMATPKHDEVTDAVAKLCALPDLESGTSEFFFACTLIEDPVKRSVLFGLPNDKLKVDYIKYLYERANH